MLFASLTDLDSFQLHFILIVLHLFLQGIYSVLELFPDCDDRFEDHLESVFSPLNEVFQLIAGRDHVGVGNDLSILLAEVCNIANGTIEVVQLCLLLPDLWPDVLEDLAFEFFEFLLHQVQSRYLGSISCLA